MKVRGNALFFLFIIFIVLISCKSKHRTQNNIVPEINKTQWAVNEQGILRFSLKLKNISLSPGDSISLGIPASWTVHMMHPVGDQPNQSYDKMTQELYNFIKIKSGANHKWQKSIVGIGLDGSDNRFSRTVGFTLSEGSISDGENLTIQYGSEEKPIYASFLAGKNAFPLKLFRGESLITNLPNELAVETIAGPPDELLVTLPSQGVIDQKVKLHVTARDQYGNPADLPGSLELRSSTEYAMLPDYHVSSNEKFVEFDVKFETTGYHTIEVGSNEFGYERSNPVKVFDYEPEFKLLWGDLHSHSHMSKDGIGANPFEYARNYANLDFYALTDHASSDQGVAGVTDEEWEYMQAQVQSFYEPDEFVTLLAYEASFSYPYGHHNIYFVADEAPIFREHETETLPSLLQMLEKHEAFAVPHHTGIAFGRGEGAAVDWTIQHPSEKNGHTHSNNEDSHSHGEPHPSIRPLAEIYSAHGQSELYDPDHPLSYDQFVLVQRWKEWFTSGHPSSPKPYRDMSFARSVDGPHYVQDAWAEGLRMGVVASSDDHTARPGQPHKGLAAAWTSEHNRKAVFDALLNKQTYGTTGQRIYLDFRANGKMQGQTLENSNAIEFSIEIAGTDTLDWVELVRFDESTSQYEIIQQWNPDTEFTNVKYSQNGSTAAGFYYVRLRQQKQIKAREVMAWSSPIWVD